MVFSESRYIALSYRWPENFPAEAKSTRSNLLEQMHGLNTSRLPLNFNDTFRVAAEMGINYVWIDSLCIIQDDADDWDREAALMSHVYQNAYLTVAIAVPPTEPDLGLFRRRDPSVILSEQLILPLVDGSSQELVVMKTQREMYGESPLVSRGWCFQEREISQRIIHYTETQVLWECRTIRASEGLSNGVTPYDKWPGDYEWPARMLDHDLDSEDINYAWRQAVQDYSSRHLTKATDKLPALAGLAAAVRRYKPATCHYLAGLWEDDFLSDLAWASHPVSDQANERCSSYIAPTWSWASVTGPVTYSSLRQEWGHSRRSDLSISCDATTERHRYAARYAQEIICIWVQPSSADPFGAVSHAFLRCTAGLVAAVLGFGGSSSPTLDGICMLKTARGEYIGSLEFDIPHEAYVGEGVTVVFCIYLGVLGPWALDGPGLSFCPQATGGVSIEGWESFLSCTRLVKTCICPDRRDHDCLDPEYNNGLRMPFSQSA